ncbi:Uncharacterized conserved protein (DUF2043) [Nesidiocoris tenuis]|uniref:Uncharacterized conserved protein (DUF2043) n=1 Tax=Nesidiocoris tenuis TaxID=355587 RepID=A0ABN7ANZ7_9HEMI|nr:Uncharacterized conserved protein (DUF2043) [Nesidiocoris tenuis]
MSISSAPSQIPPEASKSLKRLLEDITHSGNKTLGRSELLTLYKYLDEGNNYVEFAFKQLKAYLKKEHSEVRYSTVQLYDELFGRYELFREFALEKLDKFFKYALGLSSRLPPPDAAALALVPLAISVFEKWHSKFGPSIFKLRHSYKLLEEKHNVDFASRSFVDPKAKRAEEEKRYRVFKINQERLKNTNKLMEELRPEIDAALTSLNSCFELLLPSDDLVRDMKADESSDDGSDDESNMRVHGVVNAREFKIEIRLDNKVKVEEDEENGPIIEAARDSYKIINNSFLPKVVAWIELINLAEGDRQLSQSALNLRNKLDSAIAKYNRLEIVKPAPRMPEEDAVSSDSDLEEVPEPKPDKRVVTREEIGFLSERLDLFKAEKKPKRQQKEPECSSVPESSTKNESLVKSPESSGIDSAAKTNARKEELLKVAPKLNYDIDLYHWEDDHLPTPTLIPTNAEGGRFWGASISEEVGEIAIPGGSEALRTRVIEFAGKFQPVTRSCRAPLPSGKLCPRYDREKCPLHGVIVDRDDEGKIVNPEDEEKVKKSKNTPDVPDWQDPKLLAEIKAATGLDLKIPAKGQRLKRKKHPGLTDLNKKPDTPESRLSKKIFNKGAMKRVANTLDKLDRKRFRDKFGDQFNYVHDTS